MIERPTVVGVFTERAHAEQALNELRHEGFTDEQIGFVARNVTIENTSNGELKTESSSTGAAVGAVGGGVVGGVLGAAVALLIPGFGPAIAGGVLVATVGAAAFGAVAGGFTGALTAIGVPDEEAHYYQGELATGRVIVTVNAPGRSHEALDILRRNGAYDANTRPGIHPTSMSDATTDSRDIDDEPTQPYEPVFSERQTIEGTEAGDEPLNSADHHTADDGDVPHGSVAR